MTDVRIARNVENLMRAMQVIREGQRGQDKEKYVEYFRDTEYLSFLEEMMENFKYHPDKDDDELHPDKGGRRRRRRKSRRKSKRRRKKTKKKRRR